MHSQVLYADTRKSIFFSPILETSNALVWTYISKKVVIFGGPNYKQNLTNFNLFNAMFLKISFSETSSKTKINKKKG